MWNSAYIDRPKPIRIGTDIGERLVTIGKNDISLSQDMLDPIEGGCVIIQIENDIADGHQYDRVH